MKFEEALTALRAGSKITHPSMNDDEYFIGCYVGLITEMFGLPPEDFEETKLRGMSIAKMKGDRQADIMIGKLNYVVKIKRQLKKILTEEEYKKYHNIYTDMYIGEIFDNDIFNFPQLNLFLIMSDEWKIIGGIT